MSAEIIPFPADNLIRADWDRIRRQRDCADRLEDPDFWRLVNQWIDTNEGPDDAA